MNNTAIRNLFSLKNRVAIITGGAGILGMEYAKTLFLSGAKVILFDIKENFTLPINLKAKYIKVDISNKNEVDEAIKTVLRLYKKIDILINNAALNPVPGSEQSKNLFLPYEQYPEDLWRKDLDVNITGSQFCTQSVVPFMKKQKKGTIINISSIYGITGPDNRIYDAGKFKSIGYATTKGAMENFTRSWASYLESTDIRVNTLTLGGVFANQSEQFVKAYSSKTILGRMAKKDDFKCAILFLASDASRYMTGSNLIIDGGWSAW